MQTFRAIFSYFRPSMLGCCWLGERKGHLACAKRLTQTIPMVTIPLKWAYLQQYQIRSLPT